MNRESWFPESYNRCLENFLQAFVPQIISRLKIKEPNDEPTITEVRFAFGGLFLRLFVGLFVFLSVWLFLLSVCFFVYLFVCVLVCLPFCLLVCLFDCLPFRFLFRSPVR